MGFYVFRDDIKALTEIILLHPYKSPDIKKVMVETTYLKPRSPVSAGKSRVLFGALTHNP